MISARFVLALCGVLLPAAASLPAAQVPVAVHRREKPAFAPPLLRVVDQGSAGAAGWSLTGGEVGGAPVVFLGGLDGTVYRHAAGQLGNPPQASHYCSALPLAMELFDLDGDGIQELLVAVASYEPSIQVLRGTDLSPIGLPLQPLGTGGPLAGKMAFLDVRAVTLAAGPLPGPWIAAAGGDQRIYLMHYDPAAPGFDALFTLDPVGHARAQGLQIARNGAANPMYQLALGDLDHDSQVDLAAICASHLFVYLDLPAVLTSPDPDAYFALHSLAEVQATAGAGVRNRRLLLVDLDWPPDGSDEILIGAAAGAHAYDFDENGGSAAITPRWSACPTLLLPQERVLPQDLLRFEDGFAVKKPGNLERRARNAFHDLAIGELDVRSPGLEIALVTCADRDELATVSVLDHEGRPLYHSRKPDAHPPTLPVTRVASVSRSQGPDMLVAATGIRVRKLLRLDSSGPSQPVDLSNPVEANLDQILQDLANHPAAGVELPANYKYIFRTSLREAGDFQGIAARLGMLPNGEDSAFQKNVEFLFQISQSPAQTGDDQPLLERAQYCEDAGLGFVVGVIHGGIRRLNTLWATLDTLQTLHGPFYRGPSVAEDYGMFGRGEQAADPSWADFVADLQGLLAHAAGLPDGVLILNESANFFELAVPNDPAAGTTNPTLQGLLESPAGRIVALQKTNHLEQPLTAMAGAQGLWQAGGASAYGINAKTTETCQWTYGSFNGLQPEDWCPRMEVAALANGATWFLGLAGAEGRFTAGRHEHFIERQAHSHAFGLTRDRRHKRIALELMLRGIVRPVAQDKILTAQAPVFRILPNAYALGLRDDVQGRGILQDGRVEDLWAQGLGGLSALIELAPGHVAGYLTATGDPLAMLAGGYGARNPYGSIRLFPDYLLPGPSAWSEIDTDGNTLLGGTPPEQAAGAVEQVFQTFAGDPARLPFSASLVHLVIQAWDPDTFQLFLIDPRLWEVDTALDSSLDLLLPGRSILSCQDAITLDPLPVTGGKHVDVLVPAGTFRILNVTLSG